MKTPLWLNYSKVIIEDLECTFCRMFSKNKDYRVNITDRIEDSLPMFPDAGLPIKTTNKKELIDEYFSNNLNYTFNANYNVYCPSCLSLWKLNTTNDPTFFLTQMSLKSAKKYIDSSIINQRTFGYLADVALCSIKGIPYGRLKVSEKEFVLESLEKCETNYVYSFSQALLAMHKGRKLGFTFVFGLYNTDPSLNLKKYYAIDEGCGIHEIENANLKLNKDQSTVQLLDCPDNCRISNFIDKIKRSNTTLKYVLVDIVVNNKFCIEHNSVAAKVGRDFYLGLDKINNEKHLTYSGSFFETYNFLYEKNRFVSHKEEYSYYAANFNGMKSVEQIKRHDRNKIGNLRFNTTTPPLELKDEFKVFFIANNYVNIEKSESNSVSISYTENNKTSLYFIDAKNDIENGPLNKPVEIPLNRSKAFEIIEYIHANIFFGEELLRSYKVANCGIEVLNFYRRFCVFKVDNKTGKVVEEFGESIDVPNINF